MGTSARQQLEDRLDYHRALLGNAQKDMRDAQDEAAECLLEILKLRRKLYDLDKLGV